MIIIIVEVNKKAKESEQATVYCIPVLQLHRHVHSHLQHRKLGYHKREIEFANNYNAENE